jgi:hypothetical protein
MRICANCQVYTAPHAPARNDTAPAAASAAAVPAASASSKSAPVEKAPVPSPGETHTNPIDERSVEKAPIPSPGETRTNTNDLAVEKAPVPSPGPTNTDPFNAVSGSGSRADTSSSSQAQTVGGATSATRSGPAPVILGNVLGGATPSATSTTSNPNKVFLTTANTDPASASPAHTAPVVDTHSSVAIEKVAANANIGQEATEEEKTILERAQEYGLGAATTLTAVLGQAAHAVEDATGLHLTQGDPVSWHLESEERVLTPR